MTLLALAACLLKSFGKNPTWLPLGFRVLPRQKMSFFELVTLLGQIRPETGVHGTLVGLDSVLWHSIGLLWVFEDGKWQRNLVSKIFLTRLLGSGDVLSCPSTWWWVPGVPGEWILALGGGLLVLVGVEGGLTPLKGVWEI